MIRLIFPPQFEPFQPYLSLAYLKGLLSKRGINAKAFDANIDFYWWLFKERYGYESCNADRKRYLVSHVEEAINMLRSVPRSFQDYRWAVNVADEYLSAVSPAGARIALNSFELSNKYSSNALLHFINQEENVFRRYFYHAREKLIQTNSQMYLFSLVVLDQLAAVSCVCARTQAALSGLQDSIWRTFYIALCEKADKCWMVNRLCRSACSW